MSDAHYREPRLWICSPAPQVGPAGREALEAEQRLPRISVVVPSYRRPISLARCLEALAGQSRQPDEILVARRSDDEQTAKVLKGFPDSMHVEVLVDLPGQLAALTAAASRSTGEIVAFTDDDAVPRSDWLERMSNHFRDQTIGGVGGRDVVHESGGRVNVLTQNVGRISRWGRPCGNHHLGTGSPRDVEVLKGVNMAFRREALAVPGGLRGEGAQVHNEVAISGWARMRGWRLVYDPAVLVDHYPGTRFDPDRRGHPEKAAVRDASYNFVACLLTIEPHLFWRRASFGLIVGDRASPGVLRWLVALARFDREVLRRFVPSVIGQVEALVAVGRGRTIPIGASFEQPSLRHRSSEGSLTLRDS